MTPVKLIGGAADGESLEFEGEPPFEVNVGDPAQRYTLRWLYTSSARDEVAAFLFWEGCPPGRSVEVARELAAAGDKTK